MALLWYMRVFFIYYYRLKYVTFQPKTRTAEIKEKQLGLGLKRPNTGTTSKIPSKISKTQDNDSDDDFLTEDEEVNQKMAARQLKKQQNFEIYISALKDYGINKPMEKADG